MRETKAVPQHN
jgi:hypothetical protein